VRANARKKVLTFVNVSNHYEGSAPLTIGRLLEMLKEKTKTRAGANTGSS
jgi:hypothetical protein